MPQEVSGSNFNGHGDRASCATAPRQPSGIVWATLRIDTASSRVNTTLHQLVHRADRVLAKLIVGVISQEDALDHPVLIDKDRGW